MIRMLFHFYDVIYRSFFIAVPDGTVFFYQLSAEKKVILQV
jgi:hypothetical protein